MALAGSAAAAAAAATTAASAAEGGSESAGESRERGEEKHKCVFCGQQFPSKPELQTHFRLHANGVIDIKGQPKTRHKADSRPTKTSTNTTTTAATKTTSHTTTTTTTRTAATANITTATATSTAATTTTATTTTTTAATSTTTTATAGSAATAAAGKNTATCDVCGETFHTVSLAISHKFRKHPDSVLKHYCPHCGMMFPIKLSRDKHLLTHSSASPKQLFPCRPCGVTFYNQRAKKFHMDSAHKGATRMVNPVRTPAPSMKIVVNNAGEPLSVYYCHLCGCEYQVKYNLQKHLATKHSQAERDALPRELVQCNLCSAVFYSKRAYEAHSHHHREGDLFATNEQMRQQVVQRIDQDFDHRRVPTPVERYLSASAVTSNRSATWRNIQAARRAQATSTTSTFTSPISATSSSSTSPLQSDPLSSSSDSSSSPSSSSSLQFIKSSTTTSTSSISTSSVPMSSSSSPSQPLASSPSSQSLHSSSTQARKGKQDDKKEGRRKVKEGKSRQEEKNTTPSSSSAKLNQPNALKEEEEEEEKDHKNLTFLANTNNSEGKEICLTLPTLRQGIKEEKEEEEEEAAAGGGERGGCDGTQGDFLPWGMDDGRRKRRMMDESEEEEDGEVMRSLGNVNPDTILSREVMMREEEEEEAEEEEDSMKAEIKKEMKKRKEGESRQVVAMEEVKKRIKEEDEDKEEVAKKRKKKRKEEEEEEEGND